MKKIFISYSTPINSEQKKFLSLIKNLLVKNGFQYIIVNDVKNSNPFYKIKEEIIKCDAILCLAFIKNKKGIINKKYFTSYWLDIELAIALQINLKYFIFCDKKVENTCLLNKNYTLPYINYVKNWSAIMHDNFTNYLHFFNWLNSI